MRIMSLFLAGFMSASAQTIIYVDKDAAEGGDGSSWSSAYKYLNDALDYVDNRSGSFDLWIAEGTYYPDEGELYANDNQDSTFRLPSTVNAILGGFSGAETSAEQADSAKYLTKISGYIFEEYGIAGLGTSRLIQTEAGSSALTLKNLTIVNSSDQDGSVIYITNDSDRLQTFFVNCRFPDCESTQTVFQTPSSQTVSFERCHFTNCSSSGDYLITYGSFTSCYFNRNESYKAMLYEASVIDRCFVTGCVTARASNNDYQLVYGSTDILGSIFYRNLSYYHIVYLKDQAQLLHSTFVDNYTTYSDTVEIDGAFTLGYCLFYRSGLNRSIMVNTLTVGYKSTVNLPAESAFFGILDYYQSYSYSDDYYGMYNFRDQKPFSGTSVFEVAFLKTFEAEIPSQSGNIFPTSEELNGLSISEYLISQRRMYDTLLDSGNDSYTPEFTKVSLPNLIIPDPFIDSDNPLGADGIPFTEDDGLRLDPDSQWASEVINVPTITAEFEAFDILGNPRIVGGKTDLGAYEYTPLQDADGDGISDANDAFPNNPNETLDTDGDGLGDNADSDDDGDGVSDAVEIAAGTNPKQYTSALYEFVQTLGQGAYDASDIAESRQAGQSDVTSDPNSFDLFTTAQVSAAESASRALGQQDVTNAPNTYGLFSSTDVSDTQSTYRLLGQQDVQSDPLSYNLYSPTYVVSLLESSRQEGRFDVLSEPSSYNLYSESSIMEMSLGGLMIQRSDTGKMEASYTVETSEDLTNWSIHSRPTIELTPQANKEFIRLRVGE